MNALVRGPLVGEILDSGDDIRVVIATHPLRHQRQWLRMPAGDTIADMLDAAIAQLETKHRAADFQIWLEGFAIPEANWRLIRPKPGTTLVAKPVAKGFIAAIFGAIQGVMAALSGLGFIGKLILAGISFAAKLLLNALFAPKDDRVEVAAPRPSYSIAGSRNDSNPWGAIPVILGTHRVVPPYAAPPYTEVVGTEQYLRMLFVVGYGPLLVNEIKIGETPITDFEDVSYEVKQGFVGDTPTAIYPSQVIEEQLGIDLLQTDGYHQRTTAENVTEVQIDLMWANGLGWFAENGALNTMLSTLVWEYSPAGAGTWAVINNISVVSATQDMIRRTYTVTLPAGQWDIRVKKTSADNTNNQVREAVRWTALRGIRTGQPVTFDKPLALIALRIRATSQLNGVVDTLNCVATSLVTAWDGSTTWLPDTGSYYPPDLFRHVLQGPANARPVPDERIDLVSLQGWWSYCFANNWFYNKPLQAATAVFDTLREICAAGRAMPVFRDGKWSVVWDEQNTPVVQMFTPRNSWGFEAQQQFAERPHAFRVRFVNAAKGYAEDERIVYDDGYDASNATRFEGIEFPGVTDADAIWKHGRFHIAQMRLRPATYTLNVDFEGLILTRADRVRVQHDVMLVGLGAGRVKSVDAGTQTIVVDEVLTLSAASTYGFRFRLADGTFLTRTVEAATTGELTTIPLAGSDDLPEPGDLFTFGLSGSETAVYRVLGVEPQPDHVHRLTLVDDAPDIYLADSGTIPEFNSNVTQPVDPFTLPPTDLVISDRAYEEGGVFYEALVANWKLPRLGRVARVEVEYLPSATGVWRPAGSVTPNITIMEIRGQNAGNFTVQVRSIFEDGTFSAWNRSEVYNANAVNRAPANVETFRIATSGDISTLSWSPVTGVGVTYEIRFAPSTVLSPTWNTATPVFSGLSGTSVQVQSRIGTWLIKSTLPSGIASAAATSVASNLLALTGLNAVETLTEHPLFAGERDDVAIKDGELRLRYRDRISDWARLSDIEHLTLGAGVSPGIATEGYYYFANSIDLGDVFTPVRMTADIEARGSDPYNKVKLWARLSSVQRIGSVDPAGWGVELQYRSTLVAPIDDDWTDWQAFTVGDVTGRAFEFRLKLTAKPADGPDQLYAVTTPVVSKASVTIDMPDRVIAGNDIVVPDTGLRIDFTPPFLELNGVGIAAQDMASGDRAVITSKDETGFDIIFRNSGGSGVLRTFDYVAKGYGVAIT